MIKIKLAIITLGIAAMSLAACDGPKVDPNLLKTTQIIQQNDSQVGILLGKGGEWTVVGIPVGEEFESCEMNTDVKDQTSALPSCLPGDGKGEVLYEQNFKFSIVKGSLCVYMTTGSSTKRLCSQPDGPYTEALILALMPH